MNRSVLSLGLLGALAFAVTLIGCPDGARLCADCAPIEGIYAVQFEGTPTASGCGGAPLDYPDAGTLTLQREGANLSGTFEELQLNGVLYATDDFSLEGNTIADGGISPITATFSGRWVSGSAESPDRLVGTSARLRGACNATRTFSASRVE